MPLLGAVDCCRPAHKVRVNASAQARALGRSMRMAESYHPRPEKGRGISASYMTRAAKPIRASVRSSVRAGLDFMPWIEPRVKSRKSKPGKEAGSSKL